jgi:hypothetical protein
VNRCLGITARLRPHGLGPVAGDRLRHARDRDFHGSPCDFPGV